MIVRKAVNMADMLKVPLLGLVENMSYFKCPDCGARHEIFGASHISEMAAIYDFPSMARIPFLPDLAHACDAGSIETWALENIPKIDPETVTEKNDLKKVMDMITFIDDHFK